MTVSPVNKPRIDDFDTPIRPIQHHRIVPPKRGVLQRWLLETPCRRRRYPIAIATLWASILHCK